MKPERVQDELSGGAARGVSALEWRRAQALRAAVYVIAGNRGKPDHTPDDYRDLVTLFEEYIRSGEWQPPERGGR